MIQLIAALGGPIMIAVVYVMVHLSEKKVNKSLVR